MLHIPILRKGTPYKSIDVARVPHYRTGQYRDCAQEMLGYAKKMGRNLKIIFVNDGPGLLLGSMWNDYARLEEQGKGKVKVVTLRMVAEQVTADWLRK